jgi:very-short-patch-repair endonuclease
MGISSLDGFARDHHGLVTRRSAARAGFSERSWYRAIEAGLLQQLHPGICRMVGTERSSNQRILAAVLATGAGAMASHRTAARLWGVPRPDDDPVDVLLPQRSRRPTVDGALVHRPRDLLDLTPSRRERIPTTNVLRTLCDLGALDAAAVPGAVGHVVTTALVSPVALGAAIRRHGRRGRPGVPALREALGDWVLDGKPVDSVLEPAMRRLLDHHRLPPVQFHAVLGGYEVDFWVVDSPLVLECDGWATHGRERRQFERDRTRDADLAALGYVVLRFTYRAIMTRAAREAERIRRNVHRWAPHLRAAARSGEAG